MLYQVLTDRFARTDGSEDACVDGNDYCGGTFVGMVDHLDYLSDLGVDSIWISPVVDQFPKGYHVSLSTFGDSVLTCTPQGYWAKDLHTINPRFGTEAELRTLVEESHLRSMLMMVDVVANHMGQEVEDIPQVVTFNDSSYYHTCGGCPRSCWVEDYDNLTQVTHFDPHDPPSA